MNEHVPPPKSVIYDTLVDLNSGLGTIKDPVARAQFTFLTLTQADIENAYRGDWVARKIIDIPAADATRAWREWQAKNSQIDALEEAERTLLLQSKTKLALQKAGLFGGSALFMGIDGAGKPEEPLNLSRVKRGSLKFVHALSRYGIATGQRIDDLESPWYGEPEYYERRGRDGKNLRIHPSRVLRFLGNPYPEEERAPDVWADSRLQSLYDTVRRVDLVTGGTAAMVNDAKMDVIKIPKLGEALATTESTNRLIDRFATANIAKSNFSLLLLDAAEEWQRITTAFGGLNDIMRMYLVIASGAADIPVTRMLGQAPSGLHSTGESEVRNYYDSVSTRQATEITPVLSRLDDVLERSACGNATSIYYEWAPLWQLTEAEKADLAFKKAQAFQIDAALGIINEDVLRDARLNQLIEDNTYPGIEAAIEQYGAEPDVPDVPAPQLGPDGKPITTPPGQQGGGNTPPTPANNNQPARLQNTASNVINLDAAYDPAEHPHEPAGSGKGGQFAEKGDDEGDDEDTSTSTDKPDVKDIGDPNKEHVVNDPNYTYIHSTAADVQTTAKKKQLKLKEKAQPAKTPRQPLDPDQKAELKQQQAEERGDAPKNSAQFKVNARGGKIVGRGTVPAKGPLSQPALMRFPNNSVSTVSEAQGGTTHTTTHTVATSDIEYLATGGDWKPLLVTPKQQIGDAQPRSLYVRRDVVNAKDIIDWAKNTAGFTTTVPADQMHVTVAFSRTPVDWMQAGQDYGNDQDGGVTIRAGGPRLIDRFGDAIVLCFASNDLSWRWRMLRDIGASWDHADYNPHVTITWQADPNLDVTKIEPYRGEIKLGPEIFEEVKEDWASGLTEDMNPNHYGPGEHGGQFAPSGQGGSGGTKIPTKVGGSFKERTKLREMLKNETDPQKREQLKELIRKSFLKGMENAKNKGNIDKYNKLKTAFFKNGGKATDLPGAAAANSLLASVQKFPDPPQLSKAQPEPPKPANKYTGNQLISMYTGSHYQGINEGLREGILSDNQWKFVSGLNEALSQKTKYVGTTYRNVSDFSGKIASMYEKANGKIIEERGFTSTTTKENLNFGGGSLKYVITGKSGVDVKAYSSHPAEAEVLYPSGTRFRVKNVTKDYKGTRVHLEEV